MTTSVSNEGASASIAPLLDSFRALGPAKLASMALVAVGMLCMLAILVLHGGQGGDDARMALLYGDLDLREAGQMADLLEKAHIPHQVGAQGDQIMVPVGEVASARLLLAKANLPSGGSVGYEIFDRGEALTSSQFQEEINQTRALEGELVRSITLIQDVRGARVHLVLPHRELFAQQEQPAQASVLLTLRGSSRLDPEAVQAIVSLVSAAVPGLKPQSISIIDNHGNVLARNGSYSGEINGAASFDEARQAMEMRLARSVEEMLEASLGPDKVRAEASVTLDESAVSETQESYNPDQQVLRSQQTTSDKSRTTEAQQNTSVQNNLPNADAGRVQGGSQEDKREETSNYEIGKTVKTLKETAPRIQRVSLAVLVDDEVVVNKDGSRSFRPRDPGELARIATLVKGAIGFDAKRGDVVTVDSMRFDSGSDAAETPLVHTLFGLGLSNAELTRLAQTGLIGLVTLIVALFVFRPIISRLTQATVEPTDRLTSPEAHGGPIQTGLPGAANLMLPAPNGGGMEQGQPKRSIQMLSQFEIGQTKTSGMRRLGELVEQFPDESLTLVRAWLSEGVN